jgi:hypothetical protein
VHLSVEEIHERIKRGDRRTLRKTDIFGCREDMPVICKANGRGQGIAEESKEDNNRDFYFQGLTPKGLLKGFTDALWVAMPSELTESYEKIGLTMKGGRVLMRKKIEQ